MKNFLRVLGVTITATPLLTLAYFGYSYVWFVEETIPKDRIEWAFIILAISIIVSILVLAVTEELMK